MSLEKQRNHVQRLRESERPATFYSCPGCGEACADWVPLPGEGEYTSMTICHGCGEHYHRVVTQQGAVLLNAGDGQGHQATPAEVQ
ncbi:MAG: hypothetical protein ACLFVF_04150 [Thiohalospira sp.]